MDEDFLVTETISSLFLGAGLVVGIVLLDRLTSRAQVETDRSTFRTALYLILGVLSTLFLLGGLFQLLLADPESGEPRAIGGALIVLSGITAAMLVPAVRNGLASILPFDPASYRDSVGLMIILWLVAMQSAAYFFEDPLGGSVTYGGLIVQAVILAAVALAAVGTFSRRTLSEAVDRLGVARPSSGHVFLSVLAVVAIFVLTAVANLVLRAIDPSIYEGLQETMEDITRGMDQLWGAVTIGLTAAIGEELLFRGAIQPKYGLVFTAIVFSIIHVQYNPLLVVTSVLPAGIILGLERKYFNTTACIITHAIYNGIAVLLS